jgi:tetratricopeptide (TPR) repeat protein
VIAGAAAPLLVGGVHRAPTIALLVAMTLGLALWFSGALGEGRPVRIDRAALLLLPLLLVPFLQSVPLPASIRGLLDPRGTALLSDLAPGGAAHPLSLDPPNTYLDVGRAALGVALFIVVYHLASGQRRRHLFLRAVGIAAVLGVTIGITHKLIGLSKIYGLVPSTPRTLLIGPFVNANHTAEFLELGAFACLACVFQRPTMLNRACWLIGMFLCVGGTVATLSRGGVAALSVGILTFLVLRHFAEDNGSLQKRRSSLVWGAFLLGLFLVAGAAVGAGQLVDRFRSATITSDVRFSVWRDSLKVLIAHPFGIGRGAFDRVYPIYRTVKSPFPLRFAFVENEPLQLLIDCGWAFFALLLVSGGLVAWGFVRRARRDKIEAALVAGLFAVLVHNLVDFGLETPGVWLPFAGILATVLARGRGPASGGGDVRRASKWLAVGVAGLGCIFSLCAMARASSDDFDALLRQARSPTQKREILARARAAHPVDYFYALAYAELEPLRGAPGGPSPRFHALNQALILCPECESVHLEVAENLWAVGQRRQALLEYRSTVELQPRFFNAVLGDLSRKGAKPAELASIATFDPARMIDVARFLRETARMSDAITVLSQAEAMGASTPEVLFSRAGLQLDLGQLDAARATLASLRALGSDDPRIALLEARTILAGGAPDAPDRALAILDAATVRSPANVELQRLRIDLVTRYHKWIAAARAMEGFKRALYTRDGSATEGHVASARILGQLGRWSDAIGEYRIALADQPTNVALWMELGRAAESAGRAETARDAYAASARLSPNNPDITRALQRLADERRALIDGAGKSDQRGAVTAHAVP